MLAAAAYYVFRGPSSKRQVTPGKNGLEVTTQPSTVRNDPPAPPPAVWIAIAMFAARAREIGIDPAHAGDLLTRATSWWVGDAAAWKALVHQEHLDVLPNLPKSDDDLIVVVYKVEGAGDAPMLNRFEAAALLRSTRASQTIDRDAYYYVPSTTKLTNCGFHR